MRNKWIRSLALLLLAATLIALLGIGAFAAGEEDTVLPEGDGSAPAPTEEAIPTDGDAEVPSTGSGEGTGTEPPCTVTFYGYEADFVIKTLTKNVGDTLTAEDIPDGVDHWLMAGGTSELIGMEPDELVGKQINTDYSFYAAYKITYCYADANGDDVTSYEYVRPESTPTNIPTVTYGWVGGNSGSDGGSFYTNRQLKSTSILGDMTFREYIPSGETTTYTVTFYDYDGTKLDTVVTEGGIIDPALVPTSDYLKGESVNGWLEGTDPDNMIEIFDLSTHNIMFDIELHAAWRVTYSYFRDGETTDFAKVLVLDGGSPAYVPDMFLKTKDPIAGWLSPAGEIIDPAAQTITADVEFTGWTNPSLNTDPSVAYVNGIAQKDKTTYTFEPDSALTRAQAANMLYGLLSTTEQGPRELSFTDVSSTSWYSAPVYHLASYGLLNGMGDGQFEPKRGVTRAEFVQMICNIYGTEEITTASPFADVTKTTAWYYDAIMTAYQRGWVTGYTQKDGSVRFERQQTITRAEAVTILNRVLGRSPSSSDKTRINGYDWRLFIDLADKHWAYYDIMQAATGCGSTIPSTGLASGRQKLTVSGSYYYVFVTDSGQLEAAKAGLNVMLDGKSYYFISAGTTAPVYSEGVKRFGDDLYLLDTDGSVIREPRSGYDTRVYEYKNHMYYIQTDGTLLANENFGYLYFGKNGAYTSGDSVLDTWINNFIIAHKIIDNSKTQENKLYAAYVAVRDYPLEIYGDGSKGYARYNFEGYSHQQHASYFFEYAKGTCEDWAYAMMYLAQRIGYDACAPVGKLQGSNYANHVWELIKIRGTWYAFDVEQEWGYMYLKYNPYQRSDRDCWKMEYAEGKTIYYGYRFDGTKYGDAYAGSRNIWSPYIYERFNT